ncbi:MAG TPA: hypothetical protein VF820_03025 [Patescibacteria group bacterium]
MTAWKCPLSGDPNCELPHSVGVDGGLKHIAINTLLMEKGWKLVNFPKRAYYMELDMTHPSYRERQKIQMAEESNMLDVEVV